MEQDTIHWPQVELSRKTARALWAAMHDDDELVDDYANVCVIHGLNHLLTEVSAEYFTEEAWSRMVQARPCMELVMQSNVMRLSSFRPARLRSRQCGSRAGE